jgi:hypothetical protein
MHTDRLLGRCSQVPACSDALYTPAWLQVIFKNALSTSATATYKELLRVVRVIKRMLLATGE